MSGDAIASVIAIIAALALASRGLRRRSDASGKRLTMAVAWLIIIGGLVFVLRSFGLEGHAR